MSFGFIANLARQIGYNPDGRRFTNSTTTQDAITDIDNALSGTDNMISDAWNSSTTYSVGKYCIYNNCLWQCLVQNTNTTPSEGTYWTKVSVTNKLVHLEWKQIGILTPSSESISLENIDYKEIEIIFGYGNNRIAQRISKKALTSNNWKTFRLYSRYYESDYHELMAGFTLGDNVLYKNQAIYDATVIQSNWMAWIYYR